MIRRPVDRKLESFKIFPYVAWGLIILFVFFVYQLTVELKDTAATFEDKTNNLETSAKTNTRDLKDLDFEQ